MCDAAYGFSIGRGSFRYKSGGWTHLRQIVTLNTPGKQDGVFILDVNGTRIIDRSDVFYRDVPPVPSKKNPAPTGVLGSLLGGLSQVLHPQDPLILKRAVDSPALHPLPTVARSPQYESLLSAPHQARQLPAQVPIFTITATAAASAVITATATAAPIVTAVVLALEEQADMEATPAPQPIGFSGIFFR